MPPARLQEGTQDRISWWLQLAALIEAGRWLEQPGNRAASAQMLIDARLVHAPDECLRNALRDDHDDLLSPQFIFGAGDLLPHHDDARWFLGQMQRWGQTTGSIDIEHTVETSYRGLLHAQASARATSVAVPVLQ